MTKANGGQSRRARLRRRFVQDERGATAVIVGMIIIGLVGMAAYVVDVGAVFEERRDLQNGADAAALAVAMDCVTVSICSSGPAQPEAERIAGLNSSDDGQTSVNAAEILFDMGASTVTVTVRTFDQTDGDGAIDLTFAPVLGQNDKAVSATASATWGGVGGAASIPVTISSCEWDQATSGGTAFGAPRIIYLHDPADTTQCGFGPGQDIDGDGDRAEGGFGYLDSNNCSATVLVGGFILGQTGSGSPGTLGCSVSDVKGQKLLIPIFDDITADGTTCGASPGQNCYHIYGFAVFHVTDVDLNGPGWKNNGNICTGAQRCIGGSFIEFVTLEAFDAYTGPTPPDLGASSVTLSG